VDLEEQATLKDQGDHIIDIQEDALDIDLVLHLQNGILVKGKVIVIKIVRDTKGRGQDHMTEEGQGMIGFKV